MGTPDVDALLRTFRSDLAKVSDPAGLDALRRDHTGKKSPLKLAFKELRNVPADQRQDVAAALNAARDTIEAEVAQAVERVEQAAIQAQLDREWSDMTMPGIGTERGARHPLTVVERESLALLRRMGFTLVEGPEIETAFYNFDALNIPEHHPARDLQDTFWVEGGKLLRSHTTTVQARVLQSRPELPIRVASAGRVYRNEAVDATHLAMFHQLEGIWVDRGLTFAHLKGLLAFIARSLYGEDRAIRFKPKFYPYTEPSIGVDLSCGSCGGSGCEACHGAGWVTILGAGMVHPKVFEQFGYDPDKVTGIAFGLGTTRMAGQWSGVHAIRSLYETDLRVHRALNGGVK